MREPRARKNAGMATRKQQEKYEWGRKVSHLGVKLREGGGRWAAVEEGEGPGAGQGGRRGREAKLQRGSFCCITAQA